MNDSLLPTAMNEVDETYGLTDAFQYETSPDLTYKLNIESETVAGYVDELEAYKQAIYKILNTERYDYLIYSWNYGIELKELFGQPIAWVVPELERRITEAIMQDDRTESVHSFEFDTSKRGVVAVTFTASSIYGETEINTIVEI
jgi:hypothetical protein